MQNELRHINDSEGWSLYSPLACNSNECAFCKEDESLEESGRIETGFGKEKRWICRSVADPCPLAHPMSFKKNEEKEFYASYKAHGWSEIVIESKAHDEKFSKFSTENIKSVLTLYKERADAIEKKEGVESVCIIKEESSESAVHPHSKIFSLPIIPKVLQDKIANFNSYHKKNNRCFYCDLIAEEKKFSRFVAENGEFFCFVPFSQRLCCETWIVPKKHIRKIGELEEYGLFSLADIISVVIKKFAENFKFLDYNIFFYQKPASAEDFHFHIVVSQKAPKNGLEEGFGVPVHKILPEEASKFLKE